jgi:iron complex outermembrane recepter protein
VFSKNVLKKFSVPLFLRIGVLLLVITHTGYSQVRVSGTITDKDSGKPLSGANITFENTFISMASDNNGMFTVNDLKKGEYHLKISFMGFRTITADLLIRNDTTLKFAMETNALLGEEVNIIATRAQRQTPTTYTNVTLKDIREVNLGEDLPYIIDNTPSVVVTSDAGAGIGYTGINIRGTDLTRINVTINGIPLNDAESQGVWFVDLPDLASSSDNIQIQRGVGTSTNGAGAFGATMNIQTTPLNQEPYAELNSSAGSYNTFKNTLRFGTGLMANKFSFDGRISRITSDGYIDRAFSKLTSFYISGGYFGKKMILKINILSGYEKTYQAWLYAPKDSLATNRTYNPSGEYVDKNGNIAYYDNQTDNYTQTHYQLLFSQEVSRKLNINAALHYTRGSGYYENYEQDQSFSSYNLDNVIIGNDTITQTNLINRKWITNDFYGFTFSANYNPVTKVKLTLGGAWDNYYGKHYGKVIWAEFASNGDNERNWYYSTGWKKDFNIYGKASWQVMKKLSLYADLQYRHVYYNINGTLEDLRTLDQVHLFNFFNPKAGAFYDITDKQNVYFSFSVGHREPNRNNYESADSTHMPVSERMFDYELGYNLRLRDFTIGANIYYMDYKDQLVLTGMINSVGEALMTNVPHSYRRGIEITAGAHIFTWLNWGFNGTLSENKILDFTQYIDTYDADYNFTGQVSRNLGNTDLSFSPGVVLKNNFTFKPYKDLSLNLSSQYIGRQFIDNSSNGNRVLDPYLVNNISIGYKITTKVIKEIGFNLLVNNIFNVKYETNAWVYPYIYSGQETEVNGYSAQALVNFLFGITLKF